MEEHRRTWTKDELMFLSYIILEAKSETKPRATSKCIARTLSTNESQVTQIGAKLLKEKCVTINKECMLIVNVSDDMISTPSKIKTRVAQATKNAERQETVWHQITPLGREVMLDLYRGVKPMKT